MEPENNDDKTPEETKAENNPTEPPKKTQRFTVLARILPRKYAQDQIENDQICVIRKSENQLQIKNENNGNIMQFSFDHVKDERSST